MAIEILSTRQVVLRISAIIAAAEFVVMLVIHYIPFKINIFTEALIDVVLLAALSIPLIYTWVIRPYVYARDDAIAKVSLLAYTDPLTQLSNRRHLLSHLKRVIASCSRHKIYGALLVIDLDGFKLINDIHGHDAGDAVLVEIANRLRSSIRSEDVASRLGGDEFVVLIDHLDTDEQLARDKALFIADKLINVANTPIAFNDMNLQVGASAGISLIRFEPVEAELVIRQADVAMYRSKNSGKGRATFAD